MQLVFIEYLQHGGHCSQHLLRASVSLRDLCGVLMASQFLVLVLPEAHCLVALGFPKALLGAHNKLYFL